MQFSPAIARLVDEFRAQKPIRAGSLIITVYGDAIAPRGGTVWLGSLINLLEPLGLNQRLVRTSVHRLSNEGWLDSVRVGRRSYYSLTERGWRRFRRAYPRVYAESGPEWDGQWTLVTMSEVSGAQRDSLRKELATLGFGQLAPGVMIHPSPPNEALTSTLHDEGVTDSVVVLSARNEGLEVSPALNRLVKGCWNLEQLSRDYARFLDMFRPVWQSLESGGALDPQECFLVRTLLIHEIRRLMLRDPQLPDEVLPANWSGAAARRLCRNLYRLIWRQTEEHLSHALETAEGPLPEPAAFFYKRFGGL